MKSSDLTALIQQALKKRDSVRVSVLKMLHSALHNKEIELQRELGKEEFINAVRSEIKKREEAVLMYKKANDLTRLEKEEKEIKILKEFLPPPLPQKELEEIVDKALFLEKARGPKDMGRVIRTALYLSQGRALGEEVAKMVKEKLLKFSKDGKNQSFDKKI